MDFKIECIDIESAQAVADNCTVPCLRMGSAVIMREPTNDELVDLLIAYGSHTSPVTWFDTSSLDKSINNGRPYVL